MMSMLTLMGRPNVIDTNTNDNANLVDSDEELPATSVRMQTDDALIFSALDRLFQQEHNMSLSMRQRVLDEIIEQYPQALLSQNRKGCTPLHEWFKHQALRVVSRFNNRLLVAKDSELRSTLGVEQRLIQNRKGLTPLHLMLMYAKDKDAVRIEALIDNNKKVLLSSSAKGFIPLQILLSSGNRHWVHVSTVRLLLYNLPQNVALNDHVLQHNNEHSATCLHLALELYDAPQSDEEKIKAAGKFRRVLAEIVPFLTDSSARVLLFHQKKRCILQS